MRREQQARLRLAPPAPQPPLPARRRPLRHPFCQLLHPRAELVKRTSRALEHHRAAYLALNDATCLCDTARQQAENSPQRKRFAGTRLPD
ncbi:hypothetical protein AMQ83_16580 [Paenibacillus riograndensis]|nr:hypothetical protein AMQ83_16580 [Paenibacillus riograndensis]